MKPTSGRDAARTLSPFELRAVQNHQQYLSQQANRDVDFQTAAEDWQANHAGHRRGNRLHHELQQQWEEILKHKWIESERAGRDLGTEAIIDWIQNYAAEWRAARS